MSVDRCLLAQAVYVTNPDLFRKDFDIWLARNWPIFEMFEAQALLMWDKGFRHYSARTIAEWIRHHTALAEKDCEWKLNDHWTKSMARMFIKLHPQCAGFFEFRSPVMEARRAA